MVLATFFDSSIIGGLQLKATQMLLCAMKPPRILQAKAVQCVNMQVLPHLVSGMETPTLPNVESDAKCAKCGIWKVLLRCLLSPS